MADEKPATPADPSLAAIDTTRTTAKWLIGAFAAVGAAMLAGLQLTGLGKLDGWELVGAVVAVVVAVVGVAIAIYFCAEVLTPTAVSIDELASDEKVRTETKGKAILKGYAADSADLARKYTSALAAYHAAWKEPGADEKDSEANKAALKAQAELISLSAVVDPVLRFALWTKVDRAFSTARTAIGVGAAMTLIGMLVFAALATRDDSFSPGSADATPTKLVSIAFGSDREAWQNLLGDDCDLLAVEALLLASVEDTGQVELVSLPTDDGCLARRFKLDADEGVTISDQALEVPDNLVPKPPSDE